MALILKYCDNIGDEENMRACRQCDMYASRSVQVDPNR